MIAGRALGRLMIGVALAGGLYVSAGPRTSEAQPAAKTLRIGVLDTTPPPANAANLQAFRRGLHELGYVEGKTFVIEYRWAERAGQFPDLADGLVRSKV